MNGSSGNLSRVLRGLAAFVTLSAVMGLLAAGLAIPAVGATGSAIKGGINVFDQLPADLTASPLNQQSKILDASGKTIATPYAENRIIVPLTSVAPIMRKAQIAIEDSRFYEHGGLDVRGLSRAVVETLQGNKQGASTLTQQYVKLTLQENALNEDDQAAADAASARSGIQGVARKLQELKYAINLEQTHTKDEILNAYLNLAYYGDQAYGVEAASLHYFSIHASQLNYVQAALLAGTVQRPSETDPVNDPGPAFERRNTVLDRMAKLGVITPAEATAGKKVTIASMLKKQDGQNTCQRSTQPYFCTYVMEWLQEQPALGKDVAERIKNINTKGLTIQTTLDPSLSNYIAKKLSSRIPIGDKSGVGAAATVIQPGTGKVLGMGQTSLFPVGNQKGNSYTQQNWNVDAKYGGSTYGFQTGSTAKMFVLAAALNEGTPVNSRVYAKKAGPHDAAVYTRNENSDSCKDWNAWSVRNDSSWGGGTMPLRTATGASVNSAFASLTMKVGVCHLVDMMTAMGMHQGNGAPISKQASVALGTQDVAPITLAAAYATIAAKGVFCTPVPVASVKDSSNKPIKVAGANCKQVIRPDVAAGVASLLHAPLAPGGTAANLEVPGRDSAGKTGTTDSHVQTWFAGITPQLSTAVWVGTGIGNSNNKLPTTPFSMAGKRIGDQYNPGVFGATYAAPLWRAIMTQASKGLPDINFPSASDKMTNGDLVSVPYVSGMSVDSARATLESAGFSAYISSNVNSTIPAGLVAGTDSGSRAIRGSSIGLLISTGHVPPKKPVVKPTGKPTQKPTGTPTKTPKPGRTTKPPPR